MIQSISYHLDDSELDFNVQNSCGSISKYAGFLLNFRWFSGNHFDTAQVLSKKYNSRSQLSQLKTTGRKIEIKEINKGVNHTFYRSSELPAQIPQILRKFLRICQLFKVLPQRPQDQRPNSITFIWQLMDQIM